MVFLLWLAIVIARAALTGWAFMIAVGVAHAEWIPQLPTIGFGSALVIASLLVVAFSVGNGSSSSD